MILFLVIYNMEISKLQFLRFYSHLNKPNNIVYTRKLRDSNELDLFRLIQLIKYFFNVPFLKLNIMTTPKLSNQSVKKINSNISFIKFSIICHAFLVNSISMQ